MFSETTSSFGDRFRRNNENVWTDVTNLVSETCRRNDEFSVKNETKSTKTKKQDATGGADRERHTVEEWGCKMVHSSDREVSQRIFPIYRSTFDEGDRTGCIGVPESELWVGPSTKLTHNL